MKRFILPLLLAITVVCGCSMFSASRLEPGGQYAPLGVVTTNATGQVVTNQAAPDFALFTADSTFSLADSAFRTVSKLEQDNRLLLWKVSPNIKHTLDDIRPKAWAVEVKYVTARKAYILNRTPENLNTLNSIIGELQQLLAAAQAVIPKTI